MKFFVVCMVICGLENAKIIFSFNGLEAGHAFRTAINCADLNIYVSQGDCNIYKLEITPDPIEACWK